MGVFYCIYFYMKIIISESQKNFLEESEVFNSFLVKKIPVKGYSLFSKKNLEEGQRVGKVLTKKKGEIGRKLTEEFYETDMIGRYINHSFKPNTIVKIYEGEYHLFANQKINEGDEITVDYSSIEDLFGFEKNSIWNNNFVD